MNSLAQARDGKRRILFVISLYSALNTNNAGHCYSLKELSIQFARAWPDDILQILVVGDLEAGPLRDVTVPVARVDFSKFGAVGAVREILAFGDKFAPTHVHSFDNKSHAFGRWIARRANAKAYVTKAGGPNAGRYFPFAPDIVCFSQENLDDLKRRSTMHQARLHYLPQRVSKPEPDWARIEKLRAEIGPGHVLLRICRVGKFHEESILQTLRLAARLRQEGAPIRALILGHVQDQETVDKVKQLAGSTDIVVNDPVYTHAAAQLVPIAAGVVGVGRSLIEAALLDASIFAPIAESELPVLVTAHNWRGLAATNFSPRSRRPDVVPTPTEILQALAGTDRTVNAQMQQELGLDAAISQYDAMYRAPQKRSVRPVDFVLNLGIVVVAYLKSRRKAS